MLRPWAWIVLIVIGSPLPLALAALPVMKFYARPLSLVRLWLVAYWAFLILMALVCFFYVVWMLAFKGTTDNAPSYVFLGLYCVPGVIITKSLKTRGFYKPFPGIGARTMVSILALGWIAVGIAWLAGAFRFYPLSTG